MVYRFIDDNKNIFGLRWLCNKFGISLNCYYNYKKDAKQKYHERLNHIFELIKYIYYNKRREWNKIIDRDMAADFSWGTSAAKYQELYDWLIG